MLVPLLLMVVATPYAPLLDTPLPEGWVTGSFVYFSTKGYEDDAGVPFASLELDFRAEDAGYGAFQQTGTYLWGQSASFPAVTEGARSCWRAILVNTLGERSPPSLERCFRIDRTPPTSPTAVDATAIALDAGPVVIAFQPATDALSGVAGYNLLVSSTPTGDAYDFLLPDPARPLRVYLGEGHWYGWVRSMDLAGNDNLGDVGGYVIPITIAASPAVPVPAAPTFDGTFSNGYGGSLDWDDAWMNDAGVSLVLASYCNVETGCEWRHGFPGQPRGNYPSAWLQVSDEGTFIARLAVVVGGAVGKWSAPTGTYVVDRTPPPVPPLLGVTPAAARTGPLTVSWGAVVDERSGLAGTVIEETELVSGAVRQVQVNSRTATSNLVTPPAEGTYQYRVAAIDQSGNQSAWSDAGIALIDATGPVCAAPVASAVSADGGALVSVSWAAPVDVSSLASEELEERAEDGGTQVVLVSGTTAQRTVPPGTWTWRLRATDALGNVGAFGPASNAIIVTESSVAVGPAIATTSVSAQCGVPLTLALQGSGDAPLTWSLVSGPSGLTVDGAGQLSWTPPAGVAGPVSARVELSNPVGTVQGQLTVAVSCTVPDGGTAQPDAGPAPDAQTLRLGCDCSSAGGPWLMAWGLLVLSRLAQRRRLDVEETG